MNLTISLLLAVLVFFAVAFYLASRNDDEDSERREMQGGGADVRTESGNAAEPSDIPLAVATLMQSDGKKHKLLRYGQQEFRLIDPSAGKEVMRFASPNDQTAIEFASY